MKNSKNDSTHQQMFMMWPLTQLLKAALTCVYIVENEFDEQWYHILFMFK